MGEGWLIVTDFFQAAPGGTLALAALMLALGATYWLMRDRDEWQAADGDADGAR